MKLKLLPLIMFLLLICSLSKTNAQSISKEEEQKRFSLNKEKEEREKLKPFMKNNFVITIGNIEGNTEKLSDEKLTLVANNLKTNSSFKSVIQQSELNVFSIQTIEPMLIDDIKKIFIEKNQDLQIITYKEY